MPQIEPWWDTVDCFVSGSCNKSRPTCEHWVSRVLEALVQGQGEHTQLWLWIWLPTSSTPTWQGLWHCDLTPSQTPHLQTTSLQDQDSTHEWGRVKEGWGVQSTAPITPYPCRKHSAFHPQTEVQPTQERAVTPSGVFSSFCGCERRAQYGTDLHLSCLPTLPRACAPTFHGSMGQVPPNQGSWELPTCSRPARLGPREFLWVIWSQTTFYIVSGF
jgi:hypothetical protein